MDGMWSQEQRDYCCWCGSSESYSDWGWQGGIEALGSQEAHLMGLLRASGSLGHLRFMASVSHGPSPRV